jgi:hypothetical protein
MRPIPYFSGVNNAGSRPKTSALVIDLLFTSSYNNYNSYKGKTFP